MKYHPFFKKNSIFTPNFNISEYKYKLCCHYSALFARYHVMRNEAACNGKQIPQLLLLYVIIMYILLCTN